MVFQHSGARDFDHPRHRPDTPTTQGLSLWCFNIVIRYPLGASSVVDPRAHSGSGACAALCGLMTALPACPDRRVLLDLLTYCPVLFAGAHPRIQQ